MTSHHLRDNDRPMFTSEASHFFKVILQETIRDGILEIPRKFVRKYGNQLSSRVKLEVPSGATWQVELTKADERMWLQKGWPEFAERHSLELGSFVVFRYEGDNRFHVLIFDKSVMEIKYPYSSTEEEDVSAREKNKEKPNLPCPLPPKKMRTDSPYKTGTDLKLENSYSDISLDDPKGFGVISAHRSVRSYCSQKLTAAEKARAIQIVGAFKSTENPLFMVCMRPSFVGDKYQMRLPLNFVRKFLTKHKGDLTLSNSAGKTWPVKYYNHNEKQRAALNDGWRAFVENHHLDVGDICVFELIRHQEILMKVDIYPVVENSSKAGRPQARVRTRSLVIGNEPDCQQTQCPSRSREFKDSKLEKQQKSVDFQNKLRLMGKIKMQPMTPTKKQRVANIPNWSPSTLVSRKSKEKSHLSCSLPLKKMRTDSPYHLGTNLKLEGLSYDISPDDNKSSRLNLGNMKKVEKLSGQLDEQRTVRTEAFSCRQHGLTAIEKAHAIRLASAFKSSENPAFMVVMQPSFVCNNYRMCIPWDFARKFLPKHKCDLTLLNSVGETWTVNYDTNAEVKYPRAHLHGSWRVFVEDNHLDVGDICVFELMKHPGILMKVIINPVVENASKTCRPHSHGSKAGRIKTSSTVNDTERNCQQGPCPSSSRKMKGPTDSYVEILDDSPLNQITKKTLISSSFQPCKEMRTNPRRSIQAIELQKEKKSLNSEYLIKELGGDLLCVRNVFEFDESNTKAIVLTVSISTGELKYSAKDERGRMTSARRCMKPEPRGKNKVQPLTSTDKQRACIRSATAFKTSNPSFSVEIKPSYVLSRSNLHVPEEFAKRYLKKSREMILRVPDGRNWTVEYKRVAAGGRRIAIFRCKSWIPFVKDNELNVGDVCIFKLSNGDGNLLDVFIQRQFPVIELD